MPSQPQKKEYPGHGDYDLAVQNIGKFVSDPILKAGKPYFRQDGGPLSFPGGFAKAYKVVCGKKDYALRVWLHDIGDAAHHYAEITGFFETQLLPCFVKDFKFIPDGIFVNGQRFPILRMEWITGQTLGDFITSHLRDAAMLRRAAAAFLEMVRALHVEGVAHGDLQAENMIVGVVGKSVWFKLIDYDTLVVPTLVGRPISSTGLQCYQHPERAKSQKSTAHDDYFAELVIYLCLTALAEAPGLWAEFPPVREKELLFLPEDFAAPAPTAVFVRMYKIGGTVRWLAVALWNFTRHSNIVQLAPLEKIIELATAALTAPPVEVKQPQADGAYARLLEKMMQNAASAAGGSQPKHWLDEEAFLRAPAPAACSVKRAAPTFLRRVPGAAPVSLSTPAESFAEKMRRLAPAKPTPVPAPVARLVVPKPVPVRPRRIPKKVWAWLGSIAAVVLLLFFLIPRIAFLSRLKLKFAETPEEGKRFRVMDGMNMVWIAPGTFKMGSSSGDEKPVHEVRLSTGYWLGESEVTQAQWKLVMGSNPSHFKGNDLPVESVTWDEATEFCKQLTIAARAAGHLAEGIEYRLPTEAQWEYACRAGTTGDYAGNLDAMAWYASNSENTTHAVKTNHSANAWGLFDMHGNVLEWCADLKGTYSVEAQPNPTGVSTGTNRVLRGGSWLDFGKNCRSAYRFSYAPERRFNYLGFRVAAIPASANGAAAALTQGTKAEPIPPPPPITQREAKLTEGSKAGEEREFELMAGVKVTMCWVPAGSFTMGSPAGEAGRNDDEKQVQVKHSSGFWLAKHECTQAVWEAVMKTNRSNFKGPTLPVENVSWDDCQSFIGKLAQPAVGWRFNLPTEAQWEYACRAGARGLWAGEFGELWWFSTLNEMAWYDSNSGRTTHPVGAKKANAWGLHDMHGNVMEWCRDAFADTLLGGDDPEVKNGTDRLLRGGSWLNEGTHCRSAFRYKIRPNYRTYNLGFRLAAVPSNGSGAAAPAPTDEQRREAVAFLSPSSAATSAAKDEQKAAALTAGSKAGEEREVELMAGVKVTMCWVPAGGFTMGSPANEEGRGKDEAQVQVKHSRGFWLAKTECTQKIWEVVMGINPSKFKGESLPVENVSWNDCQSFVGKLKQPAVGWRFDLPSEAQWEYACRAGASGPYAGEPDDLAWFPNSSGGRTHPVGTKKATVWGLHDMHGNVWEWCRDAYADTLSGGDDPEVKNGLNRVFRGGSWGDYSTYGRSARRNMRSPEFRSLDLGFRIALLPPIAGGAMTTSAVPTAEVRGASILDEVTEEDLARFKQLELARDDRKLPALEAGNKAGEERDVEIASGVKIAMCWVPAGSFTMGSPANEEGRGKDEAQVQAKHSRGFWLAKVECTQRVWSTVMGRNPSNFKGESLPVENVSWNDCQRFIGKLERPGKKWRFDLPTEAQWEYACRAGTSGPYAGPLDEMGWHAQNGGGKTHEVKMQRSNAWGLYDMHGNVCEWCRDAYAALSGGDNPVVKAGTYRVFRGGSWLFAASSCRSASRSRSTPVHQNDNLGFRLAAVPSSE